MREIKAEVVTAAVRQLCITANKVLPEDLVQCIGCARQAEPNSTAKSILGDLENNLAAAKELDLPICQDTGMAVVFAEIGQDVHIDGDFEAAVHAGVSALSLIHISEPTRPAIRTACCARASCETRSLTG